jgi:hypothetical protein
MVLFGNLEAAAEASLELDSSEVCLRSSALCAAGQTKNIFVFLGILCHCGNFSKDSSYE